MLRRGSGRLFIKIVDTKWANINTQRLTLTDMTQRPTPAMPFKEELIQIINKNGFLLEDKCWTVFQNANLSSTKEVARNVTYQHHEYGRVETDLYCSDDLRHYIVECKSTDFSWIFSQALERTNCISMMRIEPMHKMSIKCNIITDIDVSSNGIALMLDANKFEFIKANGKDVQTSSRDFHDMIRQILKETQTLIEYKEMHTGTIIPIIVTNARLLYLKYSKGDINDNGKVTNYEELRDTPYVAYNFPEVMFTAGHEKINSSDDDENKTIFIVNVNSLKKFLEEFVKVRIA